MGYASRTQDLSWGASRRHVSKVGRSRRRNDHFRNFQIPGFVFSDTFFHGVKSCAQAWELSTIFNIRSAPGPPPPLPPHPAPSPPLPQGVLPGALVEFLGALVEFLGIRLRKKARDSAHRRGDFKRHFSETFATRLRGVVEGPGGVKCLAKMGRFANGCLKLRTGMAIMKTGV